MLRRPQPPFSSLVAAARAARTELTPALAFFVGPAEHYDRIARAALQDVVLGPREDEFVGAVLDPTGPGRMRQLTVAASRAEVTLALGPVVPVADARTSVTRARALHVLIQAGLVPREPLIDATHHDIDLLLSAEPRLARDIATQRLAPIEAVSGRNARANLEATLEAWLRRPGQRKTIAHELGVHPQTVRYRVAKLRDLFGDSLDNPDERFELQLALRVRPYSRLDTIEPAPRTG
jgi:sugar diacid utilization regulator